jgi:ATP-dependent Clp protease ATP-binding subunit ClpB
MTLQNLTQKSRDAMAAAQKIALENQNTQIEPEHLLYAMLDQEDGLIPRLFEKMNIDTDVGLSELDAAIARIPSVTGTGREPDKVYVSQSVDKILLEAERQAKYFKDEYQDCERQSGGHI